MVDRAAVLDVEVSPLNGSKARYFGLVPAAALELLACDLEARGGIFDAQVILLAEFHTSPCGIRPQV
jgi:hypothetical protein